MKKVLLKIDGMTCSACSNGLEKYLNKQEGIKQASVNLVMNNASIEYDEKLLDIPQIEKFVEKAGFESLGIDKLEKEKKYKMRLHQPRVLYVNKLKTNKQANKQTKKHNL